MKTEYIQVTQAEFDKFLVKYRGTIESHHNYMTKPKVIRYFDYTNTTVNDGLVAYIILYDRKEYYIKD